MKTRTMLFFIAAIGMCATICFAADAKSYRADLLEQYREAFQDSCKNVDNCIVTRGLINDIRQNPPQNQKDASGKPICPEGADPAYATDKYKKEYMSVCTLRS